MQSSEELNRGDTPQPAGKAARGKRRTYAVGYGKPPTEHRFQKGKSGNPKGRAKKVELVEPSAGPAPARRSMQEMFESVAYRMVRLRQGDSVMEMPLIEAGMLEIGLKAARGGRLSFATMVQTAVKLGLDDFVEPEPYDPVADQVAKLEAAWAVRNAQSAAKAPAADDPLAIEAAAQAEAARTEARIAEEAARRAEEEVQRRVEDEVARQVETELQQRMAEEVERRVAAEVQLRMTEVEEALSYKQIWEAAIDAARASDYPMSGPVPHPDEVVIDADKGSVTYTVPAGPEQGQGATLASVRSGLAALQAEAVRWEACIPRAMNEYGVERARSRRDGAMRVAAVIERMLAGIEPDEGG